MKKIKPFSKKVITDNQSNESIIVYNPISPFYRNIPNNPILYWFKIDKTLGDITVVARLNFDDYYDYKEYNTSFRTSSLLFIASKETIFPRIFESIKREKAKQKQFYKEELYFLNVVTKDKLIFPDIKKVNENQDDLNYYITFTDDSKLCLPCANIKTNLKEFKTEPYDYFECHYFLDVSREFKKYLDSIGEKEVSTL